MAQKKYNGSTDPEPGPMANQPKVQAQLRQLARVEASRVTGVPVEQMKRGQKPVAGKNTSKKKGTK